MKRLLLLLVLIVLLTGCTVEATYPMIQYDVVDEIVIETNLVKKRFYLDGREVTVLKEARSNEHTSSYIYKESDYELELQVDLYDYFLEVNGELYKGFDALKVGMVTEEEVINLLPVTILSQPKHYELVGSAIVKGIRFDAYYWIPSPDEEFTADLQGMRLFGKPYFFEKDVRFIYISRDGVMHNIRSIITEHNLYYLDYFGIDYYTIMIEGDE